MNLRKNLLSLAAIMALGNTLIADDTATYMPLASQTADSAWILFGVNGFSDGTPSDASVVATDFSGGLGSLQDTVISDDLATTGLQGWASLQALRDSPVSINTLLVGIATAGIPDVREPIRSMYIKVASSTIAQPNVKLNYRASLEGQSFEILLNGNLYTSVISQNSTWSNPAVAIVGSTTVIRNNRTAIAEVLDFNFSDNPVDAKHFDFDRAANLHLDTSGATASFFYFNATTQQWEVNQRGAPAEAQDFTDFTAGKAYWGRADRTDALGAQTIDNDGSVGLILGDAVQVNNLPNPNVYQDDANVSTLTTGWNMVSFDDSKPYIRHAATGLVLTGVANGDTLRVTDSSGLNTIALLAIATAGNAADCISMNAQVESAKLRGILPTSFNLKFFRGSVDGTVVVLSDTKFTIENTNVAGVIAVKTLFNQDPYLHSTNIAGPIIDLGDLTTTSPGIDTAVSAYGEYALVLNVLTGVDSADTLGTADGDFSKIIYSDIDGDTPDDGTASSLRLITNAAASTLAQAEINIELMGVITNPVATQIDTNFDGTADMLIVASSKPFSIEDATYIRSFNYTPNVATSDITIDIGAGTAVTTADNTETATLLAAKIDVATSGVANLYSGVDTGAATKFNVAYTGSSTFDIKDTASAIVSHLSQSRTANDPVVKGAVSGVYSLDTISRLAVGQVTATVNAFTTGAGAFILDNALDDWTIDVNGLGVVPSTAPAAAVLTYGDYLAMLDNMVAQANAILTTANLHAFVSHDFSLTVAGVVTGTVLPASGTILPHTITMTGIDAVSLAILFVDGNAAGAAVNPTSPASTGNNNVALGTGNITADLKANPAFSPNYAIYGPLYTLRDSGTGYDARAILKATTEMDATTGAIAWDSIDLTRAENEWFENNEFNLFNINHNSGYWVYLEDKAADTVVVSATATFTGAYTYYFDNALASGVYDTDNIINSGQLDITITGLNDVVAGSAYAIIGAEEVALKRSGTTNLFTATISDYGLQSFAEGGTTDVQVRAVNGKGEAVSALSVVAIDYLAPTNNNIVIDGGINLTLSADANTASRFYIFEDFIPELESSRDAVITASTAFEIIATGDVATFNACSKYAYGVENTLRTVAADGIIDGANLSSQKQIIYASLLKGATILAHDPSVDGLKVQIGKVYDDQCALTTTQTLATQNSGVSVVSLDSNNVHVATMSFQAITGSTFDQSTAWTAIYEILDGDGGIVQIQYTPEYAGKDFFIEYNGTIYRSIFVGNRSAADASILNPINFSDTPFGAANTTLAN